MRLIVSFLLFYLQLNNDDNNNINNGVKAFSAGVTKRNNVVSNSKKKNHHNNDLNKSPIGNNKLLPQSDRILHVGNLDWTIPIDDLSTMILQAIKNDNDNENAIRIQFTELSVPRRKRDEGKYHGGSAKLFFPTPEQAINGMQQLQTFSDLHSTKQMRIRWASIIPDEKDDKSSPQVKELSVEEMLRRKERAASYARRRRRVGERTDQVIESLLVSSSSSSSRQQETSSTASSNNLLLSNHYPVLDAPPLDWSNCPAEIDPMRGGGIQKGTARGQRKQAAVEAFLVVVEKALLVLDDDESIIIPKKKKLFVADLGCGAGNLSIPLAWWLYHNKRGMGVLGVDINALALERLEERAHRAKIPMMDCLQEDLLELIHHNDRFRNKDASPPNNNHDQDDDDNNHHHHPLTDCAAVVSLHACGAASDLSMAAAISHRLPFAISPCCIGKVTTTRSSSSSSGGGGGSSIPGRMPSLTASSGERSAAPPEIVYPRSEWLQNAIKADEYQLLAAAADYGVGYSQNDNTSNNNNNNDDTTEEQDRRRRCRMSKKIVETDRLQWAQEQGYQVRMLEMPRIGPLYPKRELLLGAPQSSAAATRIAQLPTL